MANGPTKATSPKAAESEGKAPTTLTKKWSKAVVDEGYTFVPSVLLRAQARLHINATELAVLLHLLDHWWEDSRMPFPSKKRLAERLRVSDKTVQRAIQRLETEGLVKRRPRRYANGGQTSNTYDLSPLVEKLKQITRDIAAARKESQAVNRAALRPGLKRRSEKPQ